MFLITFDAWTDDAWTGDAWTGRDKCKDSRSFFKASSKIAELKDTTLTTMFICGLGLENFDYVVDIDANISTNK